MEWLLGGNSEALGGLFVKAGQWLANMAATPLVWDLCDLDDLGREHLNVEAVGIDG